MNTQKLKLGIEKIQKQCSNMIDVEAVMFQTGIDCFGKLNSKGDENYQKLFRVLFRHIPEKLKKSIMYQKLEKSLF